VHYGTFRGIGIFRNLYFKSRISKCFPEKLVGYEYQHIDFSFMNILCLKMNNTIKTKQKNTNLQQLPIGFLAFVVATLLPKKC